MTAEERIVQALRAKEREIGVMALARALGVSAPLWVAVREGTRRLGARMADGAASKYPELDADAMLFLRYELPRRRRANGLRKSA